MIFGLAQAQPENFKLMQSAEKNSAVENIGKTSKTIRTLQCNFLQERKSSLLANTEKSYGVMYYKQTKKLRWETTKPKSFVFILNGDVITVRADGKSKNINAGGNKMMKMMTEMILGFVTGTELQNSTRFKGTYYTNNRQILVKMSPQAKDLKKIYTSVDIYFNSQTFLADKIVMNEASGDQTILHFSDTKTNSTLDEKIFK